MVVVPRDAEPRDAVAKANPRDAVPRDAVAKANPRDAEPRGAVAKANPRDAEPRDAVAKANPRDAEPRDVEQPVVIRLTSFPGLWRMTRMVTAKSTRKSFQSGCNGSLSELTRTRMGPLIRGKSRRCWKVLAARAETVQVAVTDRQDQLTVIGRQGRLTVIVRSGQVTNRSLSIETPGLVSDV